MHRMTDRVHKLLVENPKGRTVMQIADALHYSRTAVRHVLECLETEGFVELRKIRNTDYWVARDGF